MVVKAMKVAGISRIHTTNKGEGYSYYPIKSLYDYKLQNPEVEFEAVDDGNFIDIDALKDDCPF